MFVLTAAADAHGFRLVGGAGLCDGELQVKRQNTDWCPAETGDSHLMMANRVCAELNCGSAVSIKQTHDTFRKLCMLETDCSESTL